ncbi:MAG: transcriptional regulator [Bacteroidetes bacterium]|nr:MAG: transcriptional regulator [Bacteroidota bacterium]PTM14758.1 MAG: transcriptional regulator [Bacteroidota bacterium]
MKKLTKAEEEIMHALWALGEGTVGAIRNQLAAQAAGRKPAHSTISTMMKILGEKAFVTHQAYGRTFVYRPTLSKADYSHQLLQLLVHDYFEDSAHQLVTFLLETGDLRADELQALLKKSTK